MFSIIIYIKTLLWAHFIGLKTFFKRYHRTCHNSQSEHAHVVYHSHKLSKSHGRTDLNLSPQNVNLVGYDEKTFLTKVPLGKMFQSAFV